MTSRYNNRDVLVNLSEQYSDTFRERNVNFIRHYSTPNFKQSSIDELVSVDTISIVWKTGTRLYKLAATYYNDPELWWVIAWYNRKPTEFHIEVGEVIEIPVPVERVLSVLGV
jgi:hypothetical protein